MPTDDLSISVTRPDDLWRAWEATASYVAQHTRQEATLHLSWNSQGVDAPWMAQFNWINNVERVNGYDTAGEALLALWKHIEENYKIYPNAAEARQAPRGYPPGLCFTSAEQTLLDRLTGLPASDRSPAIVTLLITYHALNEPKCRLQTRLISHVDALTVRGQGSTLLKACQNLYPRVVQQLTLRASDRSRDTP
jgi:hypothetical protein